MTLAHRWSCSRAQLRAQHHQHAGGWTGMEAAMIGGIRNRRPRWAAAAACRGLSSAAWRRSVHPIVPPLLSPLYPSSMSDEELQVGRPAAGRASACCWGFQAPALGNWASALAIQNLTTPCCQPPAGAAPAGAVPAGPRHPAAAGGGPRVRPRHPAPGGARRRVPARRRRRRRRSGPLLAQRRPGRPGHRGHQVPAHPLLPGGGGRPHARRWAAAQRCVWAGCPHARALHGCVVRCGSPVPPDRVAQLPARPQPTHVCGWRP